MYASYIIHTDQTDVISPAGGANAEPGGPGIPQASALGAEEPQQEPGKGQHVPQSNQQMFNSI